MSKHRTARGREFNMQAFTANQGDKIAVGNSGRNARGDLLGPGGRVIATKQEIAGASQDQFTPANSKKVRLNPMEQEINRKEVIGADGVKRWEVTYADGSVEVIGKEESVDIDRSPNLGDL